jgi:glycerophosphoryl diester phosphodiesterase
MASGGKFTPEIKFPDVTMPYNGFTQDDFVAKMVKDYVDMNIPPSNVWVQTATFSDLVYLVGKTAYGAQAVALDFEDDRVAANDQAWIDQRKAAGVKILAPPTYKLVAPNPLAGQSGQKDFVPSEFAKKIKASGLGIITWTLSRTGPPLDKPVATDYYWFTLQGKNLSLTEGSNFDLLDVFYQDVGIIAIFDDWPSVSSFYANCMEVKLRYY